MSKINNMERYKPLTHSLRIKIDDAFDRQIGELKICKHNALGMARLIAGPVTKRLIRGLSEYEAEKWAEKQGKVRMQNDKRKD